MTVVFLLIFSGLAQAQVDGREPDAAARFSEGQRLYSEGQYAEAIEAFSMAFRLQPHPSALFNIARCHENLGNPVSALKYYTDSLARTQDAAGRADIKQRIQRLRTRPVKILVVSHPPGASVTVDARAAPEPGKTPLMVNLTPGEHVLIVRRAGHRDSFKRTLVEMGKEKLVDVRLDPLSQACPSRSSSCPRCRSCPEPLLDMRHLHLHLSAMGAFGVTASRPFSAGPGLRVYLVYKRVFIGPHFLYFLLGDESFHPPKVVDGKYYSDATMRWMMMQIEGGYVFPFRSFYLYSTLGLGISADNVIFAEQEGTPRFTDETVLRENLAFTWSVGGGIEAHATSWLSLGIGARFGMIHGKRADLDRPGETAEEQHFPYGTFTGNLTFRL